MDIEVGAVAHAPTSKRKGTQADEYLQVWWFLTYPLVHSLDALQNVLGNQMTSPMDIQR